MSRKNEMDAFYDAHYTSRDTGTYRRLAETVLGDHNPNRYRYGSPFHEKTGEAPLPYELNQQRQRTKEAANPKNWSANTRRVMMNAELGYDGVNKPIQ